MRIDVLSIFPDYLAPLSLSLPGKARDKGLLDLHVHDLRSWTTDRHHTVDDTPYGGGAGMVMKPEPWGEALDEVATDRPTIVFTTPSGQPFTQALARELSTREHLVFACGRYEGIDQRVIEHAATLGEVREISLGDYVLNGGEVAALAITEAVVRLLPGFMGNAESLVEESHEDGLLEYPVYTKPASWRGHDVPDVLLSGDHGRIAAWRREQAVRRTAERRPDLVAPSSVPGERGGPPRHRRPTRGRSTPCSGRAGCRSSRPTRASSSPRSPSRWTTCGPGSTVHQTWVVRRAGRLVGSVRARLTSRGGWDIGRLMVAPDLQGQGLGRLLLEHAEEAAPPEATTYLLFTGARSAGNLRMYKKAGYRLRPDLKAPPGAVVLTKRRG